VKQRNVVVTTQAIDDLVNMSQFITARAGSQVADAYIERLKSFLRGFDLASERGTLRDDIRKNLRIVGFEKRVTVAFKANSSSVFILRIFWGGQNWQKILKD
jgi:toxin ParE1/3/4